METIVLATDFSVTGNNAVRYGCEIAKQLKTKIVLAHAYSLPLGGYDSMAPLDVISEMQSASHDALRELRKELQAEFGFDNDIITYAGAGSSEGIIEEVVERFNASLVVLGIVHGAGAIKIHLTGSTVTDLIHELRVPVLVVPQHCKFKPISQIVFAFDPKSDKDTTPVLMVKQFASLFKAKLDLLSVLPMPIDARQAELVSERIEALFADVNHNTTITHAADVAKGLEKALQASKADLVVMHPKKHSFLSRLFESGTTTQLIYALEVPMLSFHV